MLVPIFKSDEEFKKKLEDMKKPLHEKEIVNEKTADNTCMCGNPIKAKLIPEGSLKAKWKTDNMCRQCRYSRTTGERVWELSDNDLQKELGIFPTEYLKHCVGEMIYSNVLGYVYKGLAVWAYRCGLMTKHGLVQSAYERYQRKKDLFDELNKRGGAVGFSVNFINKKVSPQVNTKVNPQVNPQNNIQSDRERQLDDFNRMPNKPIKQVENKDIITPPIQYIENLF